MNANARSNATTVPWRTPRLWLAFGVLALGAAVAALRPATAQEAPATLELASADELYDLVGPIALYPDDLVAIVLPASTYPLQVVQAARFLDDRERDSSLQPDDEWDDSIIALLNYPEVVELMNDDLDWTYDLGTAVLNQRADVLNAIQEFRDEAYAAGNLRSDERQTVALEDDSIVIKPASPQVIYVPYYEPREVVVYQTVPVYHYYPRRYAVYYYPYPSHYHFDTGFFWGVRSWYSIGWHTRHVHLYDWHYHGHPYFGWRYYDPFYVHNVFVNVNVNRNRDYIWQPRDRYGGRPVVRGNEGRVYTTDRAPRRGVLDTNAAAARTREGSVYRTQQGTARAAQRSAAGARTTESVQPRRGVPSTAYRNRAAQTTERATEAAQARAPGASGSVQPQGRERPAESQGAYRSGGGMSQALERNRAVTPPSRAARAAPPRAMQGSTGMPREAARSAPAPRAAAPAARAPSQGAGAQRGDSGGGAARGNSDGGSYRGGSSSTRGAHPAARNSAGR